MKHLLAFVSVLAASSTAMADSSLYADQFLFPGQKLVAPSCYYELVFQADGNLVLTGPGGSAPFWGVGSNNKGAAYARMQEDGNLVIYTWSGGVVWASQTYRYPWSDLQLQDDGNVVIYDGSAAPWASGTVYGYASSQTCSQSSVTTMVQNTDMYGGDYTWFYVADPTHCASSCAEDTRCKAYTYVPPRNGIGATCHLKNSQPAESYSAGMVSGQIIH